MTRDEALALRAVIERSTASLDDKTASTAPTLFPSLKQDGKLVRAGTRINWRGAIKRPSICGIPQTTTPSMPQRCGKASTTETASALFPRL